MSNQDLIDFGIWREMDEDLTAEEAKQEALAASQQAIADLSEEVIEDHSERAGLPVTELTRLDDQFDRHDPE
jgi:hypothetical protein